MRRIGERGEWEELEREENGKNWERMEKHRKDRKIGNSDFIDSSGNKLLPTHTLEQCK